MSLTKCPKCGEEYDAFYSFHECKREEGGKIKILARILQIIGWISVGYGFIYLVFTFPNTPHQGWVGLMIAEYIVSGVIFLYPSRRIR